MTLEVLFAQQNQCSAFLQLCVLGLAAGMLLHASVAVHRRRRIIGSVLDVVCCMGVAVLAALVMLRSGSGVRLYGLLGLVIGMLLYAAGVMQAVRWLSRMVTRGKAAIDSKHADRQSGDA